jgi:hypothetical protein
MKVFKEIRKVIVSLFGAGIFYFVTNFVTVDGGQRYPLAFGTLTIGVIFMCYAAQSIEW